MRRILIVGAAAALLFLATGGALISTGVIGAGSIGATFRGLFAAFGGESGRGSLPGGTAAHGWTEAERGLIASLSIDRLPPLPPDPSNAVGDDPNAVALGHTLFFDSGLSPDGTVSCGTCHMPENYFTDGKVRANVRDVDTPRHTPTIVGIAYSDWFYWDGRKDSQWAQALAPQEAAIEHAGNRTANARFVLDKYRSQYEALFGAGPDLSDASRFPPDAAPVEDEAIRAAWEAMTEGRSGYGQPCLRQHRQEHRRLLPAKSCPAATALTTMRPRRSPMTKCAWLSCSAHRRRMGCACSSATGSVPIATTAHYLRTAPSTTLGCLFPEGSKFDQGRSLGTLQVNEDVFNCLGEYSDASEKECVELRFIKLEGEELVGAFKVPSLRNVANTAPYTHNGIFPDLDAVLRHYNHAPPAFPGHSDLVPLALTEEKSAALKAFLLTLSAPPDAPPELLRPPEGME